jgi:hypothetical protein
MIFGEWGVTNMNRLEHACPFTAEVRANHCQGCIAANTQLPPCVLAWLRNETNHREQPAEVIPFWDERRKAA